MISPHQIRYTLLPQEFAGNELEYFEVATADFIPLGIYPDDLIWIDRSQLPENHQLGVFSVEGRDLLRFVEWKLQSARLYLPERPADDLILSRNEFEVVGSVIKLERLFQRAEA